VAPGGDDPGRLGLMGFSAGGNVAVRVAYADDPDAWIDRFLDWCSATIRR